MNASNPIYAVAVFNDEKIKGVVRFTEDLETNQIKMDVSIKGLKPNFKK